MVDMYGDEEEWEVKAIVFDNGSETIKAGFVERDAPLAVFPTLVGRPRELGVIEDEVCIGEDAAKRRAKLELRSPIERGIVTDWDAMERIWRHAFYDALHVQPEEYSVLLTEPPMNPQGNRERMATIMLESFGVVAVYISLSATLSLYSCGRTTGLNVDLGAGLSNVVPVFEGLAIPHAIQPFAVTGEDLTLHMMRLMADADPATAAHVDAELCHVDAELASEVKEMLSYVALDFDGEVRKEASSIEAELELSNGQPVKVGSARFRCPEALFQPSLLGKDCSSLPKCIANSVSLVTELNRVNFYEHIVLSGGGSMFQGLDVRLAEELKSIAPASKKVKVIAPASRKYATWIGGSILGSLSSFQEMWVTKSDFAAEGPAVVQQKCKV